MKPTAFVLAAAFLALSTTSSSAQMTRPPMQQTMPTMGNSSTSPMLAYTPGGTTYGTGQPSSATVGESWYRGWADAVRAQGEYSRDLAAAQIDWETARKQAIDNWAIRIRTTQKIRDEHIARDKAEHPPLTTDQQREITRSRDPKRLSIAQLSPEGVVAWPTILQTPEFAAARESLDALFAERARAVSSDSNGEIALRIDAAAKNLTAELADSGANLPVMEKINAKNFINALRLEARQPRNEPTAAQQVATATRRS